jgi:large subunit ribosomal protein L28e
MATVPGDLIWQIVRKNNSFLVKQFGNGNAKVQFTKEPNNLYNVHSYKYSGMLLSVSGLICLHNTLCDLSNKQ